LWQNIDTMGYDFKIKNVAYLERFKLSNCDLFGALKTFGQISIR